MNVLVATIKVRVTDVDYGVYCRCFRRATLGPARLSRSWSCARSKKWSRSRSRRYASGQVSAISETIGRRSSCHQPCFQWPFARCMIKNGLLRENCFHFQVYLIGCECWRLRMLSATNTWFVRPICPPFRGPGSPKKPKSFTRPVEQDVSSRRSCNAHDVDIVRQKVFGCCIVMHSIPIDAKDVRLALPAPLRWRNR